MTNYCPNCECDECLEQEHISHYHVWGGEFQDIENRDSLIGEWFDFGEYDTYQEALDVWNYEMRRNLDNHHYRVFIDTIYEEDEGEEYDYDAAHAKIRDILNEFDNGSDVKANIIGSGIIFATVMIFFISIYFAF